MSRSPRRPSARPGRSGFARVLHRAAAPLTAVLFALAAPVAAPAHEGGSLHGPLGLPAYEGDWAWGAFTPFEWLHDARGAGEIRVEETAPNAVRFGALTALTVTNWDGSSCQVAEAQAPLAELTLQPNGVWSGTAAFGVAQRSEADREQRMRCTGASSGPAAWDGAHLLPTATAPADDPNLLVGSTIQRRLRYPSVPYVALGDSYSSGEAVGRYDGSAGRCHRSADAWPRLLAKISQQKPLEQQPQLEMQALLACSGAVTANIARTSRFKQPPQLDELARLKPRFVTLTIGGNDVGFGEVLGDCFTPGECLSTHKPKQRPGRPRPTSKYERTEERIEALRKALPDLYRTIAAKLVDPERLVVVGYPDLIPSGDDRCAWLGKAEKRRLVRISERLEAALKAATSEAGVRFISLEGVTKGHEMCTKNSWFVDITTRRVTSRMAATLVRSRKFQELAHPRLSAQRAIAEHVATQLGVGSGR
ncbi:SGNH/GDSL hydrolase family protein [Patulibacter defluvii]|uniref:SGNH/GDSL hydrolase family protein n=1 Tax=Patulibacter defluvii TaxID=3095358 RepID=UPI002A760517|nr:SGNH/GDSL hydrolase family protein [Patulibacter sp. DM4]